MNELLFHGSDAGHMPYVTLGSHIQKVRNHCSKVKVVPVHVMKA
jgi:hypothetical protein